MPPAIPLIGAAISATVGAGMIGGGLLATIAGGTMIAGGVLTGIGALTGNQKLTKFGGLLSLAGGAGSLASGMAAAGSQVAGAAGTNAAATGASSALGEGAFAAADLAKEGAFSFANNAGGIAGSAGEASMAAMSSNLISPAMATAGEAGLSSLASQPTLGSIGFGGAAAQAGATAIGPGGVEFRPDGYSFHNSSAQFADPLGANPNLMSGSGPGVHPPPGEPGQIGFDAAPPGGSSSGIFGQLGEWGGKLKDGLGGLDTWAKSNPNAMGMVRGAMDQYAREDAMKEELKRREQMMLRARQRYQDSIAPVRMPTLKPGT